MKAAKPKHKYIVTLSIETPRKLTKKQVRAAVLNVWEGNFPWLSCDRAKIRVRTVDFD